MKPENILHSLGFVSSVSIVIGLQVLTVISTVAAIYDASTAAMEIYANKTIVR